MWDCLHSHLACLSRGGSVHSEQFASKNGHNLVASAQYDVAGEVDPGGPRDRPDVVVHRVALEHSPGGGGAADPFRVVEDQGRLHGRETRGYKLRAARKTSEEMGL